MLRNKFEILPITDRTTNQSKFIFLIFCNKLSLLTVSDNYKGKKGYLSSFFTLFLTLSLVLFIGQFIIGKPKKLYFSSFLIKYTFILKGVKNINNCPRNQLIPVWLFLNGIFGVLSFIIRLCIIEIFK